MKRLVDTVASSAGVFLKENKAKVFEVNVGTLTNANLAPSKITPLKILLSRAPLVFLTARANKM